MKGINTQVELVKHEGKLLASMLEKSRSNEAFKTDLIQGLKQCNEDLTLLLVSFSVELYMPVKQL